MLDPAVSGAREYETQADAQGEAAEGEEASATEGVEAADATMPDGTPLTAEYSFQEVFAEYRTRNETFLESLEVELRRMDELANNHEADMCDKSASVKEYAAKLAQQKSEANAFKEKMRQFLTTTWQGPFSSQDVGMEEAGEE